MSLDPDSFEARLKLVDEHVQAEVERDLDKIMETWGESPDSDPRTTTGRVMAAMTPPFAAVRGRQAGTTSTDAAERFDGPW